MALIDGGLAETPARFLVAAAAARYGRLCKGERGARLYLHSAASGPASPVSQNPTQCMLARTPLHTKVPWRCCSSSTKT